MATAAARASSILDSLLNRAATAGERQRILAAFGTAEAWLKDLREHTLDRLKITESRTNVLAAEQTVATEVSATFAETP